MLHATRWKYRTRKNRYLRTIAQLHRAMCSQLRHVSTIGKNLLNSNIFSRCPHNMANFGPLTAEIGSGVWGTPCKFQWISRLGFITAAMSLTGGQPNFAWCLAVCCSGIPYTYFWGLLPPGVILPVQNSLVSKSCVLLCWQHYCSAFQQRDQLNFAALSRGRHLYSAGWPSHWASVHILVAFHLSWCTFKQQLVSLRMHRYVIVSDKLQRKSCYRESEISWEWRYHCTSYISREA